MRLVLMFVAILAIGCDRPEQAPADPSFAEHVQPVLNANCAVSGCHIGPSPTGNYNLSHHQGVMSNGSDSIPNVIPGRADSSNLYMHIESGEMPPGGPPLEETEQATIRNWINQGAKNN